MRAKKIGEISIAVRRIQVKIYLRFSFVFGVDL